MLLAVYRGDGKGGFGLHAFGAHAASVNQAEGSRAEVDQVGEQVIVIRSRQAEVGS